METMINWLWQGTLVAGVTAVLLRVIGSSRAHTRYWTVWVALLLVVVLPLLTMLWPALEVAADPGAPVAAAWSTVSAVVTVPSGSEDVLLAVSALVGIWMLVYWWRVGVALCALRRVRRESLPFPAAREARLPWWRQARGTGRQTRLALSVGIRSAAVLGGRHPMIAVSPALLDGLTDEDLDRVIVHEWAHVQRRDDVAHVLQVAVKGLAGWHPAVWWLDRQLHLEREISCDERAVAVTGSPTAYALCLARLASLPVPSLRPLPVVAALGSSALNRRIVRILSRGTGIPVRPLWTIVGMASGLLLAVTVCVGVVRLVALEAMVRSGPLASRTILMLAQHAAPVISTRDAFHVDAVGGRPSPTGTEIRAASERKTLRSMASHEPALLDAATTPGQSLFDSVPSVGVPQSGASTQIPYIAREDRGSPWSAATEAGVSVGRGSR